MGVSSLCFWGVVAMEEGYIKKTHSGKSVKRKAGNPGSWKPPNGWMFHVWIFLGKILRPSKGKLDQTHSPALSVCSGRCNKMPPTGWIISTVQEAETLRRRRPHGQVRADFALCPHTAEGPRELSGNSFLRVQILWHPTPVLLPGKSHGRRSLVGCRLWGLTELDTTEAT